VTQARYGDLGSARLLGRLPVADRPAAAPGRKRVPQATGTGSDLERFKVLAACQGADPELFFGPDPDAGHESIRNRRTRVAAALGYCGVCDVRDACLAWALANVERGIWGGTTEEERSNQLGRALKNPPKRREGSDDQTNK